MSKAALKKELNTFTGEELVKVVLDVYDASKEAKQFLEYFLNPDPEALFEKKCALIEKELGRVKRGYCRARISVIKVAIKEFGAYGVGPEYMCRLMAYAVEQMALKFNYMHYTDAYIDSVYKFTGNYIYYANDNGLLTQAMDGIKQIVDSKKCTARYGMFLRETAATAVKSIADGLKWPQYNTSV